MERDSFADCLQRIFLISMKQYQEKHQLIVEWLHEARKRILDALTKDFAIDTKANKNDLVTEVDRLTEQFFIEKIRKNFPGHKILGEEGFGDELQTDEGVIWLIDPIDGTMNFVHQKQNFAISLAIYENGTGMAGYIYDVVRDELYYAIRGAGAFYQDERLPRLIDVPLEEALIGMNALWLVENKRADHRLITPLVHRAHGIRSYGSAALELAYVATGRLNGYISFNLMPWDYAAGKVIVEEVGGLVTTTSGRPVSILKKGSLFVSTPDLHKEIIKGYLAKAEK